MRQPRSVSNLYKTKNLLFFFRLASFLMTSQDVSLQSQLDYQREYSKANYTDDDEEELMEVDSGTEEYLLTDDDF